MAAERLITTLGDLDADVAGFLLPHEHVFVEFRPPDTPGHAEADSAEVVEVMAPFARQARQAGVGAIVEATPVGVGRRPDIVLAVSRASGLPFVVPTGVYREPWVPRWVREAPEEALADWMIGEIADGIEGIGVRAGWIKISVGDDGITPVESKVLAAAARASAATGAVVGSHTVRGRVLLEELDAYERSGGDPARFIWIHAQAEADREVHRAAARRGAWLEYDNLGGPEADDRIADLLAWALEAGLEPQLLISQDRGYYDPAKPRGGTQLPYTHIVETFLPRLRASGMEEATIALLTRENPFRAFAR